MLAASITRALNAMKMGAANISETSVNFYQTTHATFQQTAVSGLNSG
jgi:hypothetical protein